MGYGALDCSNPDTLPANEKLGVVVCPGALIDCRLLSRRKVREESAASAWAPALAPFPRNLQFAGVAHEKSLAHFLRARRRTPPEQMRQHRTGADGTLLVVDGAGMDGHSEFPVGGAVSLHY